MTKNQSSSLTTLTWVGTFEGISFLLLLGVAMPLKYYLGYPEAVRIFGTAHGVLFLTYLVVLMATANKVKMPLWGMPMGVIAAILPFGPFVFDRLLKKAVLANHAAENSAASGAEPS